MKANEIYGVTTFGDGLRNKNDGVMGSPPSGFKPNPKADEMDVRRVYVEMAKRLSWADWQGIKDALPDLPEDVLLPRTEGDY